MVCRTHRVLAIFALFLPFFACSGRDWLAPRLALGKELFTHEWVPGDPRSHAGDGLGPVYNAQSCASCHRLGGIGGAGTRKTDVTLVSIAPQSGRKSKLSIADRKDLAEIHPSLRTQDFFPLHRFGAGPEFTKWEASIRSHFVFAGNILLTLTESTRNTPALFGAGVIDAIPDRAIIDAAAEQEKAAHVPPANGADAAIPAGIPSELREFLLANELPVKGRVARLKDSRIGRFGWKGNVPSLREFILQACSNELGLEVPGLARAAPPWKKKYKAPGIDLTSEECDALTAFVASLPKPQVYLPATAQQGRDIENGRQLFASVGCAVCHRQKLGDVDGIYSDLLLHDMGGNLSDSGSYGVVEPEIVSNPMLAEFRPANEREWRTPPLWGLRDSAPYLHDGRATSIVDAVLAHGGEGSTAAQAFWHLKPSERQQIEIFLQTLCAPALGS
jgi:CxxC motif-containing protein (DUF1111 family)